MEFYHFYCFFFFKNKKNSRTDRNKVCTIISIFVFLKSVTTEVFSEAFADNWGGGQVSILHRTFFRFPIARLAEWSKACDLSSHNRKIAWVRTPHLATL